MDESTIDQTKMDLSTMDESTIDLSTMDESTMDEHLWISQLSISQLTEPLIAVGGLGARLWEHLLLWIRQGLAPSQSIWAHQFGGPRLFLAPK